MPEFPQKLIDDIISVVKVELDLLKSGKVYLWKNKESRDKGASWVHTTRYDVYQRIIDSLSAPLPEGDGDELDQGE